MTGILVYIPDLPADIPENDLQKMIETHLQVILRLKVNNVKCYTKLGVAVIKMLNDSDKKHLVSNVQAIILDVKRDINITFAEKLELDFYIVIDQNTSKIPSVDDITRQFMQQSKVSKICTCETVSDQFSNIFRLSLNSLEELVKASNISEFKIKSAFATVYSRVECSFFEDLPPHSNEEKIISAIAAQISENHFPPKSFYVQHNQETGNAIVIASKSIKKWMMVGHLAINGQNISKKVKLAYRVLISPVPRGSKVDDILRSYLFADRVISHKHIADKLIVELNDLDRYNECLQVGAFSIKGNRIGIERHVVVSDPESSELDALNWYETAMFDIKPDITTIINDHQHPIFHYKWNANNWIQQMKKADRHSRDYDLTQRLLRVTAMLNTIGVLGKEKYLVDDEEIRLKLKCMKTISYDHKTKLLKGKKISESEFETPYSSTTVKVISEDSFVLYERLVSKEYRPLLLSMANAINPGGGYRKGDAGQEEDFLRRSDYYHSLDEELADKDRSERFYYTDRCQLRQLRNANFYPMEEFQVIYTSGITVFRGTEANGYPYMKEPLYDVCAITMPAYRDPPLTHNNMLENKFAMNTYRKIENSFAIGYQQEHDCLILSALGCDDFKNPPKHIALLFKSVIYQYAGYFRNIYFAINDGGRDENFLLFKELLDGLVVHPPTTLRVHGITGPHRILEKTSDGQITLADAYISDLPPCQHGSHCPDIKDTDHKGEFSHPPRCSLQSGTSPCGEMNDEVHTFTFSHTPKCEYGGECTNEDPVHLNDYNHPEFCKNKSRCVNMDPEHLFDYRHLPICENEINCLKYLNHEPEHMGLFRHCRSICPDDNCCSKFHDERHMRRTLHSFNRPCRFTPYKCSMYIKFSQTSNPNNITTDVKKHCLKYSHVCSDGRQCTTKDDKHYETSIHIARHLCPDKDNCTKTTDEYHLESFTHPGIRDIRPVCDSSGFECPKRFDNEHLKNYRHIRNHIHLSVSPSSNLNEYINFVQNQRRICRRVNNYIETTNGKTATISQDILDWILALQPVHRCSKHIFESILIHAHVMSRQYMSKLKSPNRVTKAVLQHNQVRPIFLRHNDPSVREDAFNLIKDFVKTEFVKTGSYGITELPPGIEKQINTTKMKLKKASLSDDDLKIIHDWTVKIAKASVALHNSPMGVGWKADETMQTDKHVFSILGPHHDHRYGDIIIIFKQELMFHPDSNFSIQAASSFYSGRTYKNRPWTTDPGTEEGRCEDFYRSKLHCSIPRYEYAAATELIALIGKTKNSTNITVDDVMDWWVSVDSHQVFEGHLPQFIPLDYIDRVYMPKIVFESLTHEAQQSAKAIFKDSLIIRNDLVDLSQPRSGRIDPIGVPYLQFIIQEFNKKIQKRIDTPNISRGIVITVPGSKFEQHIVMPIKISQSYDLYLFNNDKAPHRPEYTYIYWQAMYGDMMLAISNKIIEPDKDQPNLQCLICYVAATPSTATECYSYLNSGHPFEHYTNVHQDKFKAKSNVFYRGCNTDDFLTFCLKLSHRTGEVTLSHAGPNGVYNHEKIYYQFDKSDVDLREIDYVHVSGGEQDVPIRNLTINHELLHELHPSFDKDFKIDTSELLGKRQASVDHEGRASFRGGVPKDNNGASNPSKQRSSSVPPSPSPLPPPKTGLFEGLKNIFRSSSKGGPRTPK